VPAGIELVEGEHPLPGRGSLAGGEKLLAAARALRAGDHALVLLSGGASALAEVPAPGISLEDLRATTKLLLASGVPIAGINAVRKHLSALKGGRLALACGDATLEVLALSDVAGDDPATIASGPFTADPTTFADALRALENHCILEKIPAAVRLHLEAARDETPKELRPMDFRILAGPLDLPKKAAEIAAEWGFVTTAIPTLVDGDVEEVAARWRTWFVQHASSAERGCLLAAAAEPTVTLPPEPGSGGRSQHLALRMALAIAGTDAAFLAAGSDGKDGRSDHAGAAVDGDTARSPVEIEGALTHAASAAATARLRVALPAWTTGTNLADLHLLAIGR
jgi:hydroxypyruvate reductase